jgi:hypothetical protein
MSSAFTIELSGPPRYEALFAAIGRPALRCQEGPIEGYQGDWRSGALHLYLDGESTRSVEVGCDGAGTRTTMTVRILALSSPADYELAFRIVEQLGAAGRVSHEEEGELPADQLRARFSGDWMARDLAAAVQGIVTAAETAGGGIVRIAGPVRSAYLGGVTLGALGRDGSVDPVALLERLRSIQYLGDVASASAMDLPGVDVRLSVWKPDEATLYFDVSHVGVKAPEGNLYVPATALAEVFGRHLRQLDDWQFVIEASAAEEQEAIIARAASRSVDVWARAEAPRRWWQIWRR